jgi:hypothetical protein
MSPYLVKVRVEMQTINYILYMLSPVSVKFSRLTNKENFLNIFSDIKPYSANEGVFVPSCKYCYPVKSPFGVTVCHPPSHRSMPFSIYPWALKAKPGFPWVICLYNGGLVHYNSIENWFYSIFSHLKT